MGPVEAVVGTPHDRPAIADAPAGCRRFTIGDAMILVAAAGIGLALTRGVTTFMVRNLATAPVPRLDSWAGWRLFLFGPNQLLKNFARFANLVFLQHLIWFVLASVLIRLRPPRPPLRSLWRQPGFATCAAPVLVFVALLPVGLLPVPPVVGGIAFLALVASAPLARGVLMVARAARPEPGWVDRLGRVVGGLLIASTGLFLAMLLLAD